VEKKEIHEGLAHALIVLAALHAAAALVHHWIVRDRTLIRMLPGSSRRSAGFPSSRPVRQPGLARRRNRS
jgi:cytochrome b